jgi:hypothetical protein
MHISTWDYNHAIPGSTYTQSVIITNDWYCDRGPLGLDTNQMASYLLLHLFHPASLHGARYWYHSYTSFPSLAPWRQSIFPDISIIQCLQAFLWEQLLFSKIQLLMLLQFPTGLPITTPWNNINYFTTITVSSYDPNFKEVSPEGTGPTGLITRNDSVLEYMVHFQNTGTAPAQNIVVVDTLIITLTGLRFARWFINLLNV